MKQLFLVLMLFLLVSGCADRYDIGDIHDTNELSKNARSDPFKVTPEEAIIKANNFIRDLSGGGSTKAASSPTISLGSVGALTRSDSDLPIYVVNYPYNAGYVLVSGDKRTTSVLGASERGNFHFSDTIYNKSLGYYLQRIAEQQLEQLSKINSIGDEFAKQDTITKLIKYVEPMLDENVRKWNQGYPYNSYCPYTYENNNKQHYLVGCCPLTSAMIMSYFKYPTYIYI